MMKISQDFLKLWIGQTISGLGTWLGALGLLAILHLNATPVQMGVLETLGSLPVLLIGLFAGVWVDRLRRRPLLIWADLGRVVLLGSVVVAALLGVLRIEFLYGVGFLVGCLTILFEHAWHAYVPTLVERPQLVNANSRLSATASLAEIVSPGLGGLLVQWIGAPLTVLVDAISFLVSAIFIGQIRTAEVTAPVENGQPPNIGREIREGLQLVRQDERLRALTGAAATSRFFGGFFQALYGLFILRVIGLNPATMGALIGAGGLGSLAASLLVGRIVRWAGFGPTLVVTLFVGGALELLTPLAALPGAPAFFFVLTAQLCGDVFGTAHAILATSLRQRITPLHALGRVNASYEFLAGGLGTVGIFAGGLLGEAIGMTATLVIAASGIALAAGWLLPIRNVMSDE
jgi:predicted MFS family arabinose efflux permease